ncbi:imidazole glycerol phosphate synthase hisHF, chloroplastic-like [Fagus crenata]
MYEIRKEHRPQEILSFSTSFPNSNLTESRRSPRKLILKLRRFFAAELEVQFPTDGKAILRRLFLYPFCRKCVQHKGICYSLILGVVSRESLISRALVAGGNGLPEQDNNVLEFVQPKNNINIKTNIIFFSRVLSSLGFTVLAVEEDEFFYFFFLFAMLEEAIGGSLYIVRFDSKPREDKTLKKKPLSKKTGDDADVSFLNITGFQDFPLGDLPMLQVLRYTSENVFVPLTVGGGIRDFTDANGSLIYKTSLIPLASEYFRSVADKISIGSDAVYAAEEYLRTGVKTGKSSLEQISRVYGNQAVVVSIDLRRVYLKNSDDVEFKAVRLTNPGPNEEEYAWYQCTVNGGREGRPIGAYELAKAVEKLGAEKYN